MRSRWIGFLASGLLLLWLYRDLDLRSVGEALSSSQRGWLIVSVGMIVPITLLRAYRFFRIAPIGSVESPLEALKLNLVASAGNVFLPAKLGDLIKSYFLSSSRRAKPGVAISAVVFERLVDLLAMLGWFWLAWLVRGSLGVSLPPIFAPLILLSFAVCAVLVLVESSAQALFDLVARLLPSRRLGKLRELASGWPLFHREVRGRKAEALAVSTFLWLVNLLQLWLFAVALNIPVPIAAGFCIAAMAVLAGQIPFTFAGLGTRDLAFVVLLSPYATAEAAAAVGILSSTRVILPALAALPLLGRYLSLGLDPKEVTDDPRAR